MKILWYLSICFPLSLFSQFQDDFSDGDFSINPSWLGDIDSFEVDTAFRLHLNAPSQTEESYLSTYSLGTVSGYWEFNVSLDFNPSSSNKAYVYLISDTADLKQPLHGYYVLIGNTSDEVSLYRQDGNTSIKIIDGIDGILNTSQVSVRVKVSRNGLGNFSLYADTSSSLNNYILQGSYTDNSYMSSQYFGILCDYTSSRSDKFWFDNFTTTSQVYVDTMPPRLDSFTVHTLYSISLYFNESLDSLTASTLASYYLNNAQQASAIDFYADALTLYFNQPFLSNNTLHIQVRDQSLNLLDTSVQFMVNIPIYQHVVINEIYADETPSFGMPNSEFIELKNTSTDTIRIQNWYIADATDTLVIPNDTILPLSYIILCKTTAQQDYALYGKSIGVPNFPSLNNSGDQLKLFNSYMALIDSVSYSVSWYKNQLDSLGNEKKEGGYSLERIHNMPNCTNESNWFPSVSTLGATPGKENSVTHYTFPAQDIEIRNVFVENDSVLSVFLNHDDVIISQQNIYINDESIEQAFFRDTNTLTILIAGRFDFGKEYTYSLQNLTDCYLNTLPDANYLFYRLQQPEQGDLVINEILFNPISGGVDFLELKNTSDKALLLDEFLILEYDVNNTALVSDSLYVDRVQIMPNSFVCFTEDTALLQRLHIVQNPQWLIECSLPNFNDDRSIVVVKKQNETPIDSLYYDKAWHFELLDVQDGVSLERINPFYPSLERSNWHSAARTHHYATPTSQNSQYIQSETRNNLTVVPDIFTPDEDGVDDYCIIEYINSASSATINITIYDTQGREIKRLAQNELLGTENRWKWNGTNANFEKASIGIYIIYVELFTSSGQKISNKKTVVLGANLN